MRLLDINTVRMADVWNASLHSQQGLPAALQHLENDAIYNANNVIAQVSASLTL